MSHCGDNKMGDTEPREVWPCRNVSSSTNVDFFSTTRAIQKCSNKDGSDFTARTDRSPRPVKERS